MDSLGKVPFREMKLKSIKVDNNYLHLHVFILTLGVMTKHFCFHDASKLTHRVFSRPQFLTTWTSPPGCLAHSTWKPASPREPLERVRVLLRWQLQSFCNLTLKVMSITPSILVRRESLSTAHSPGKGIKFYLLARGVLKNL